MQAVVHLQCLHDALQHVLIVGCTASIALPVSPAPVQQLLDVAVELPDLGFVLQLRQ